MNGCPVPAIARGPYQPAMRFDNRTANGQPHSHAINLRREERAEQAIEMIWVDARTTILHRDEYLIDIV
jgi:hypothetical protein